MPSPRLKAAVERLAQITIHPTFYKLMNHEGVVKFSKTETLTHKLAKTIAAHHCQRLDLLFWTELKFLNDREADLLFLTKDGFAYVMEFETRPDHMKVKTKLSNFLYTEITDIFVIDIAGDNVVEAEQVILKALPSKY